jgi:hypothetical protein
MWHFQKILIAEGFKKAALTQKIRTGKEILGLVHYIYRAAGAPDPEIINASFDFNGFVLTSPNS